MSLERRVVITGLGLVTPLGSNVINSWHNLIKGQSGIKRIKSFDTSKLACKIAAIVSTEGQNAFNPESYIDKQDLRKMDSFIQFGVAATAEAIKDSNWAPTDQGSKDRTGVIIGSGIGGLKMIEKTSIEYNQSNSGRVSPYFIPSSLINLVSGQISIKYGFTGPNHAVVTACTTGTHAIGDAARIIKYGDADVMIAGGAEAAICPVGVAGFASAKALSTKYNDFPEKSSRPWDINRDGFVMGEGAGIVVIEEYEHAKKRGAKIYAEITGYGMSGDAYHITAGHPEGRGAYRAMENALKDANLKPKDINYINAHGTSTPIGDALELKAVQNLFYNTNSKLLMSSTKSSIGHLLGAAGSVELIFTVLAMQNNIAPATLNLENPMEEVKIDLVPNTPKEIKINHALSNSFGFGGTNASLIISRI